MTPTFEARARDAIDKVMAHRGASLNAVAGWAEDGGSSAAADLTAAFDALERIGRRPIVTFDELDSILVMYLLQKSQELVRLVRGAGGGDRRSEVAEAARRQAARLAALERRLDDAHEPVPAPVAGGGASGLALSTFILTALNLTLFLIVGVALLHRWYAG